MPSSLRMARGCSWPSLSHFDIVVYAVIILTLIFINIVLKYVIIGEKGEPGVYQDSTGLEPFCI